MSEDEKLAKLNKMIQSGEVERNPEAYVKLWKSTGLYKKYN